MKSSQRSAIPILERRGCACSFPRLAGHFLLPPGQPEGKRSAERRTTLVSTPCGMGRALRSARRASRRSTCGVFLPAPGRAFLDDPHLPLVASAPWRKFASSACRAAEKVEGRHRPRQPAPGRGPFITPGRSPGVARVRGLRGHAAQAPHQPKPGNKAQSSHEG